jgi:hypothetical protein
MQDLGHGVCQMSAWSHFSLTAVVSVNGKANIEMSDNVAGSCISQATGLDYVPRVDN